MFLLSTLAIIPATASQATRASKLQLAYDQAAPGDVFGQLARGMNLELSLDESVRRWITVQTSRISYEAALDAICETAGCRWRVEGGKLFVEPLTQGERSGLFSHSTPYNKGLDNGLSASMRFENTPLPSALRQVFDSAGVAYILFGESMSRSRFVTVDVSNQRVADALAMVLKSAGIKSFGIMQTNDESPSYFIFIPPSR
jgi:hypothetical protein